MPHTLPHPFEAGEEVVLVALAEHGGRKSAGCGGGGEGLEIDIEPVERVALGAAILHLVVDLAEVVVEIVGVDLAVVVAQDKAEVARVDEGTAARGKPGIEAGKKLGQRVETAADADAIHEHQNGVERAAEIVVEEVGQLHIGHAALAHGLDAERTHIDGAHLEAARLQRQTVATTPRTDVEHSAASQLQGGALEGVHLCFGAKQMGHGHFVFVEHRRQHAQSLGAPSVEIVANGLPHRIVLWVNNHGLACCASKPALYAALAVNDLPCKVNKKSGLGQKRRKKVRKIYPM